MKKGELKKLMEECLDQSKELLLRDGYLMPVAFVMHKDNFDTIGLSFRDNDEKNRQFTLLRKLVKEKNANTVFVIIESWYVASNKKDLTIEPANHPMRKECIMMIGECEEGNITIMQIFDRKDGEIIFGEKIDMTEMGEIDSLKLDFGIKKKGQNKNLKELS